jgi:hypothetical protein
MQDPDYPAKELNFHSPHTKGWQSPRFCKFPQELTLQLEKPAQVHQIQLLSHEYKASACVEMRRRTRYFIVAASSNPLLNCGSEAGAGGMCAMDTTHLK